VTPEQAAAAGKRAILKVGGAFAHDPRTMRKARQLGLTGWAFYVAGRGGALGDVRADTVAGRAGLHRARGGPRRLGRRAQGRTAADIAAHNLGECCRWGREHLSTFFALERLVELAERVVVSAEAGRPAAVRGVAGHAGSRRRAGARAAVLMHLLREHRGAAHLLAIRASNLTPLEAIIAGRRRRPAPRRSAGSRRTRRSSR
jgi:hypothetical protein